MNEAQVRSDQIAYGRQQHNRNRKPQNKEPVAKGHEAFLKALESSGVNVIFEKASSGEKITGTIKTSDKYTISVAVPIEGSEAYKTRVLFKHDISEFTPLTFQSAEIH